MGKHDAAPTYGWVFTSWINKWVVRVSLFVTAIAIVAGATLIARVNDDCTDKPKWSWQVGSYVVDFGVSKTCDDAITIVGNGG
jgi:hypothetical protein